MNRWAYSVRKTFVDGLWALSLSYVSCLPFPFAFSSIFLQLAPAATIGRVLNDYYQYYNKLGE